VLGYIKYRDNYLRKEVKGLDIPFWIYFIVIGIIISAYMVVRTGKEERRFEEEMIEREGEIYMERLEKERSDKREMEKSLGAE
jgi:hypothetical protein